MRIASAAVASVHFRKRIGIYDVVEQVVLRRDTLDSEILLVSIAHECRGGSHAAAVQQIAIGKLYRCAEAIAYQEIRRSGTSHHVLLVGRERDGHQILVVATRLVDDDGGESHGSCAVLYTSRLILSAHHGGLVGRSGLSIGVFGLCHCCRTGRLIRFASPVHECGSSQEGDRDNGTFHRFAIVIGGGTSDEKSRDSRAITNMLRLR